jgi:hypothetical protein
VHFWNLSDVLVLLVADLDSRLARPENIWHNVTFRSRISSHSWRPEERKSMKRTFVIILSTLAAAALFGALVHVVLMVADVSEPTPATVQGLTPRRLWAIGADVLALAGVVIGSVAMYRAGRRIDNHGRRGAVAAMVAGLIAAFNGGLNLAVATGGPGSGNGVIGGAGAFVLGMFAMTLGGLALARSRRAALAPERGV